MNRSSEHRLTTHDRDLLVDAAALGLLVAVVCAPLLLGRGVPLVGDMVFVPDQPWKPEWLGLDGGVPRFVPGEAAVWALSTVLGSELAPRILLVGALLAAGWGARALLLATLGRSVWCARWAAMTSMVWNPWVLERFAIGQWPMVVGLAALPWLVVAVLQLRRDGSRTPPALLWGLLTAAIASPPTGVLALLVAVVLVAGRARLRVIGVGVVANLAWLVPALVGGGPGAAPQGQFAAFGMVAETVLGVGVSALSGGGIWKVSVVPDERSLLVVVLVAAVVALACVTCLVLWTRRAAGVERSVGTRLLVLGLAGLGFAVLLSAGPVADLADTMAARFPPLGFARDAHRWLAPWLVAVSWGAGIAVDRLWHLRIGQDNLRHLAALAPVLPLVLLPSMAWGAAGSLRPVQYPAEWGQVQRELLPATTVVLPWRGTYRGFAWNDHRAMLDPAPRMFAGTVLIDDRILLSASEVLASEDPRLDAVTRALGSHDPAEALRDMGVTRVLVEKGNGVREQDVPSGEVVHDGPGLKVVDLGAGREVRNSRGGPARAAIVVADLLVAGLLLAAAGLTLQNWRTRRRSTRSTQQED